MTYKYRAKKGPTDIIEGRIDAQSETEAVEKVSSIGLFPLSVELEDASSSPAPPARLSAKIRSQDVTVFTRQLAGLLKAGVPILQSLNIIVEQSDNHSLKNILRAIHDSIKEGAFFSASLARYPRVFPALYVAMIGAGEGGGALPEALLRVADYRTQQEDVGGKFRAAMAYPVLMGLVGIGTIVFMLAFVIPRLTAILVSMGQELPLPTRVLISVSRGVTIWWIWVCAGVAGVLIRRQMRAESLRLPLSVLVLHLPLFGRLILKAEIARFSRTLELLIRNGIPILRALEIAIPVVDNEAIMAQLKVSRKELEQGGSFGRSIRGSKYFPPFVSNLILVGEESGKLADALGEVASNYDRDTEQTIKTMMSLIEPAMILIMGLVVGFIVMAMLLPVFDINTMAR